ncbi:hypothetical protein F0562_021145 [Nyssa sinensis]|uniref:Fe2OG dioxygenase domain-containing protein n=1 Tax=Nyssa sinensis TaxID=561372 RepID=A0A5J5BMF1_9ASTE|nr:hypothetical protein F0562_021145 [Nyssa sinensis]
MDDQKIASSWFNVQSVPETYRFPPERRPGKLIVPLCKTIPVINLEKATGVDRIHIIQQISEASQTLGFFQVINHGVSENIIVETMRIFKDFFSMSPEEKASAPNKSGWIYTSSTDYAKEGVHLWRENFKQPCHPLEECIQFWPNEPTRYRDIVGTYLVEVKKLSLRILELICEGLRLEPGYFKEQSEVQLLSSNHYPPCPDPSLTLGILRHIDPSLITIVYQGDVSGLQVFKDGQWIGVEAIPNAFVVNIGNQLQIISNGKLRSAEHRAVTNPTEARTSIATFINPSSNCIIEPAQALVNALNPPLYEAFLYKEFVNSSKAFGPDTDAIQKLISSEPECIKGK